MCVDIARIARLGTLVYPHYSQGHKASIYLVFRFTCMNLTSRLQVYAIGFLI